MPIVLEVQSKAQAESVSDVMIRRYSCRVMEHGQSFSCIVDFDFVIDTINLTDARNTELIVKKFEDEWRLVAVFDVEPK